jgi:hypothetical protein
VEKAQRPGCTTELRENQKSGIIATIPLSRSPTRWLAV